MATIVKIGFSICACINFKRLKVPSEPDTAPIALELMNTEAPTIG